MQGYVIIKHFLYTKHMKLITYIRRKIPCDVRHTKRVCLQIFTVHILKPCSGSF